MGSCTMVTIPTSTIRMEMTMATIGRSMKNRAMAGLLRSRARLRGRVRRQSDFLAGAYPVAALDDDPLAGLQPLGHRPHRANPHIDLDRSAVDRVFGADHGALMNTLNVLTCQLQDQSC